MALVKAKETRTGQSLEEPECYHVSYARFLFIKADDVQQIPILAPVVILQNDINNVYGIIERHFDLKYMPQPDRYWRTIRLALGFEGWRPRVNGSQIKMLSNARFPHSQDEWALVGEAISSVSSCLRNETSTKKFLEDLQNFVLNVEQWWASTRGGTTNKRSAPQQLSSHRLVKRKFGEFATEDGNFQAKMMALSANPSCWLPPNTISKKLHKDAFIDMGHQNMNQQRTKHTDTHRPEKVLVILNVGGKHFSTTKATLISAPGSYFSALVSNTNMKTDPKLEFYIDRGNKVFEYVLDHLRIQRYHPDTSGSCLLPENPRDLEALLLDSKFYKLPRLEVIVLQALETITAKKIAELRDIYIETGPITCQRAEVLKNARDRCINTLNEEIMQNNQDGFRLLSCQTYVHGIAHDKVVIRYHALMSSSANCIEER